MDLEKILDELKGLISDIGQDAFSSKFLELARRLYHCVHTAQTNKELRNFLETQFGDQSASEVFKNLQKLSFDLRSSDGIQYKYIEDEFVRQSSDCEELNVPGREEQLHQLARNHLNKTIKNCPHELHKPMSARGSKLELIVLNKIVL